MKFIKVSCLVAQALFCYDDLNMVYGVLFFYGTQFTNKISLLKVSPSTNHRA